MKGIKRKFADVFELPSEAVYALPVLTVTGRIEVIVENYEGVIEYSPEIIRLGTSAGTLNIEGLEMDIKCMNSQCVKVTGQIDSFFYEA